MPVSRRELLKLGLLATPGVSLARLAGAQSNDPGSPPVFPFTRPLRIPKMGATSGSNVMNSSRL